MALQRLNIVGPLHQEATGIVPPMVRAMMHLGYAIAVADGAAEEGTLEEKRPTIIAEVREAFGHLNSAHAVDLTPFISAQAIREIGAIKEQLSEAPEAMTDMTQAELFDAVSVLADNMAYISAVAENYLTGGSADEGRNP